MTAYTNDFIVDNGAYMIFGIVVILRALQMLSGLTTSPTSRPIGQAGLHQQRRRAAPPGGPDRRRSSSPWNRPWTCWRKKWASTRWNSARSTPCNRARASPPAWWSEQWPFPELCDAIKPHYERAKKEAAAFNEDGPIKRGVGIACPFLRHRRSRRPGQVGRGD